MEEKLIKNKFFWGLLIIIFLGLFLALYCVRSNTGNTVDFSKVDSISTKNDSLQLVINRLDSLLQVNKIEYEAQRDSIISQSVDDDCDFFSKYILSQKSR